MQMTRVSARILWHAGLYMGLGILVGSVAPAEVAAEQPAPRAAAVDEALTRIELHRNGAAGSDVAVTFAIPFPPGELFDPAQLRIVDASGVEVPAHVEDTLRWHFKDRSIRSARVHLKITLAGDTRRLRFEVGKARMQDLPPAPYADGLVDGPHDLRVPGVLATLDPRWLTRSLVAGPQQPFDPANAYDRYVATQFTWAGALPVTDSTAWLFDRPTTLFKLYVRSGRVEHLRAAVESYRFYMGRLVRGAEKCAGGWRFGKAQPCDAKYVYIEPILLALALTGDDSQHDAALIERMVGIWDTGGWSAIGGAYARVDQAFTERHAGLGLLAVVSAFELTGNPTYARRMLDRIGWLHEHQTRNPDGLGNDGAWRHSWQRHEGKDHEADTDIRGASPWMSENIIDGLWHAWLVTADPRIAPMITAFGQYLEQYGWITPATFAKAGRSWRDACSGDHGQIAWYWSSSQAPLETLIDLQTREGEYSDAHTVELALPVAAARYFETDPARQRALDARLAAIAHSYAPACAATRSTARRFNWNHRGSAVVQWFIAQRDVRDAGKPERRPD